MKTSPSVAPAQPWSTMLGSPRGAVPHDLPGENPFVREYADTLRIPLEAAQGGRNDVPGVSNQAKTICAETVVLATPIDSY
jgi:hypothetical protein